MATIFKHEPTGQILRPGKTWKEPIISKKIEVDKNGNEVEVEVEDYIQHSPNWHLWSADHKISLGITEIIQESSPDPRLYTWSYNDNGTINNTAKPLDGVKSSLRQDVNKQQGSLLLQTDWMYIRKIDKGEEIPLHIQSWRDAIRVQGDAMKAAIDAATTTEEMATLFIEDGGILYEWPELEK
jgi:hypothetical protein